MNNYHKHTHYSTIMTPDSAIRIEDYAKRAIELGDTILSSVEHGFQGNYFETYRIAKKYNLKFVYGAEAYWVKDRLEKDKTNGHICIFAKTNKGRKALNLALHEANDTGYYYKPRLDLDLIMKLPPQDVFITTACIAFWKYEDIEDIVKKMHNHFQENFMLEIQYHNTPEQIELNRRIVRLSESLGIEMIIGQDSHYIFPEQATDRDEILLSKGIIYEDEDDKNWYLDYPDNDTVVERLKTQKVLNDIQIKKAMDNTNLFNDFEDFNTLDIFSNRIKIPTLYPELSQDEKDEKLFSIIMSEWEKTKCTISDTEHQKYLSEITKEFKIIKDTHMSDYFLLDYEIVKDAVANGGEITGSGRGSGVSMYINTLLGFSKIDRISSDVTMFPERFMSVSRILEAGSLPDLDLNLGNPEVFAQSQKKLLGEHNSYPMIAYDEFGKKSSWKMYAKAKNIDFEISNRISQYIEAYESDLKYASDDEKDMIIIEDYIAPQYLDIYKESAIYHGIISGAKAHPCGYLIYDFDIREEIGTIRLVSESTKKSTMVCLLDGFSAEKLKFLKNDLLKVDVVKLAYAISRKINKPIPTEKELISLCENNKKVWDIYKNGITVGVNQVEKEGTTKKVKRFAPQNIAELCAFIAAIRPSFQSMYKIFEKREDFRYGIPTFDKIIRDTGLNASFILYQETIMAVLGFTGFPQDKTYDIIKAISKKRHDVIDDIKPWFIENFTKIVIEKDNMDKKEASIAAEKVWTIIENSSQYGFNASHSYSYSYDSLLCAYYKSEYPMEFYEVLMQEYSEKGNKKKVQLLRKEMRDFFGINVNNVKFGDDNRRFTISKDRKSINMNMCSIKGIGEKIAEGFWDIAENKYDSFTSLLYDIVEKQIANKSQILKLIQIGYFKDFGNISKLTQIYDNFYKDKIYSKKTAKKTSNDFPEELLKKYSEKETPLQYSGVNYIGILKEIEIQIPDIEDDVRDIVKYQMELLDTVELITGNDKSYTVALDVKETIYNTRVELYCLASGKSENFKIKKQFYNNPIKRGDIVKIDLKTLEKKYRVTPRRDENGDIIKDSKGKPKHYDKTDEMEWILNSYVVEE